MKKSRAFGINLVFLIALVLLTDLVSSQEIDFQYPSEINCGKEFSVKITLIKFPINIYDVKIDIKNAEGKRISEIFDGDSWHSTYNYVNDAINNSNENFSSFQINITEYYDGESTIEVKIRDSSNKAETFTDYILNTVCENNTETPREEEEKQNEQAKTPEIFLKLEWDEDEIINGEEFEIESRVYNLEAKGYELKVYITFRENDTIISETYYEDDDKWKSSAYYINEAVTGPGNKSKTLSLRIKDEYVDFKGNAKAIGRIRKSGTTSIIAEFEESIEILEKEIQEEEAQEEQKNEVEVKEQDAPAEEVLEKKEIIRLGGRKETQNQTELEKEVIENKEMSIQGEIIYESGSEKTKKYSIYIMNVVLVAIIVFLLISFKKEKTSENKKW